MDLKTIMAIVSGLGITTLIEIIPVKLNPWSGIWAVLKWIWRGFCRSLNAEVLSQLEEVKDEQQKTTERLESHIRMDDEREADKVRSGILRFNNELLRNIPHTKEEFVEVLSKIDWYNDYCKTHEEYKNSRAVHAISNIERAYDERLMKHDFL